MIRTLLVIFLLVVSFGWLIKSWWKERKAEKEFEKRQERYRRMI